MIAGDPRLDEVFLCQHFNCRLAKKHCLRRQAERQEVRLTGRLRVPPALEYCASGECTQGNAIREELGEAPLRVQHEVAVRFPGTTVYRDEPARPAKETTMAAHPPCPRCRSAGRHKSNCPRLAELATGKAGSTKPRPAAARPRKAFDPAALTDDELASCLVEARERSERIQAEGERAKAEADERAARIRSALAAAVEAVEPPREAAA